jgi:type VI secretion system protein ImpH
VGTSRNPNNEIVKFTSKPIMHFPATEILDCKDISTTSKVQFEFNVAFMGLAGMFGPLPYVYSEMLIDHIKQGDYALKDFYDIFNNRLISLFYRARKKQRLYLDTNKPEESNFAQVLYSLNGFRSPYARELIPIPKRYFLYFTNLFLRNHTSSFGLKTILQAILNIDTKIYALQGAWWSLSSSDYTLLGKSGQNQSLGHSTILGKSAWEQASGIKVTLSELIFTQYLDLLPGKKLQQLVDNICNFYTQDILFIKIHLIIKHEEIITHKLGDDNRLGYTSWLTTFDEHNYTNEIEYGVV